MSTPRIYVACLASYNNGVLHGRWIDANQSADDLAGRLLATRCNPTARGPLVTSPTIVSDTTLARRPSFNCGRALGPPSIRPWCSGCPPRSNPSVTAKCEPKAMIAGAIAQPAAPPGDVWS